MEIISVNKDSFDEIVINSKMPVLVDFNADWCGPCRMLSPILEEIASNTNDKRIVSINIDDEEELADKYGVSSIPCLILFKDGSEVSRSVGLKPKEKIEEMLGE